jgi:ABC-2 type transport system ATP-binding protein
MSAVEVDSLDMRYGDVVAVQGLSFAAGAGAVTCVLGRNGAGKTSTIEALEGLRRPDGGRLSVLGFDPQRDHAALVLRVGVMLQEIGLPPAVRVGELARCTADLYPASVDVGELLERLDLVRLERRTIRQLSGGEQRRLAMALALVGRPQVVFLDEPTAGVDADGREVIRQIIGELRDDGVAVLLTTHDLTEAERVADEFVVIESGRLRAQGTLDDLRSWGGCEPDVRFRAPPGLDTLDLADHLGGWHNAPVTEIGWGDYRVAAEPTPALIAALTSWLDYYGLPLADLRTGHATLEDLFLELTTPDESPPEILHPAPTPAAPPRRPLTGHGLSGRPPGTGEHSVTPRRPVTGQQPVVAGYPSGAAGRPTTGEHAATHGYPTTGGYPATGPHTAVAGAPTTGGYPVVGDQHPTTSGEHPLTERWPATTGRSATGEHAALSSHTGTGEHRLAGQRPVSGRQPVVTGGRPTTGQQPVVAGGKRRGMGSWWPGRGRPATGTEPVPQPEPASAGPRSRYPDVMFRD